MEAKRIAPPGPQPGLPRPASFRAPQAQRRPTFLNVISVTHRLSEAVPVSRPPALEGWRGRGSCVGPFTARRAPSAPAVPVVLAPGLNSCILSVPPAMSAAVLPAIAGIPQASARLDRRIPTCRPSRHPDGSGSETWAQLHNARTPIARSRNNGGGAPGRCFAASMRKPAHLPFRAGSVDGSASELQRCRGQHPHAGPPPRHKVMLPRSARRCHPGARRRGRADQCQMIPALPRSMFWPFRKC